MFRHWVSTAWVVDDGEPRLAGPSIIVSVMAAVIARLAPPCRGQSHRPSGIAVWRRGKMPERHQRRPRRESDEGDVSEGHARAGDRADRECLPPETPQPGGPI